MNLNFWRSDFTYGIKKITTSKVVFKPIMTFDVLFDVVIFVVVINSFWRSENLLFNVLIALIILFDVVMVCMVFGVLFGFRRSDFRSSDLLPFKICNCVLIYEKYFIDQWFPAWGTQVFTKYQKSKFMARSHGRL